MYNFIDCRLQDLAVEYILVSLLSQKDYVHALSFDLVEFAAITWEQSNNYLRRSCIYLFEIKIQRQQVKFFRKTSHKNAIKRLLRSLYVFVA